MSLKFSVADGGFVQASVSSLEFRLTGQIESPLLTSVSAPVYVKSTFPISSAVLAINNGKVGSFKVEVRSTDLDGSNEVVHISDTLVLTFDGTQGWGLDIDEASISADKVLNLYAQHISGGFSSDISLTLG